MRLQQNEITTFLSHILFSMEQFFVSRSLMHVAIMTNRRKLNDVMTKRKSNSKLKLKSLLGGARNLSFAIFDFHFFCGSHFSRGSDCDKKNPYPFIFNYFLMAYFYFFLCVARRKADESRRFVMRFFFFNSASRKFQFDVKPFYELNCKRNENSST